ncbi:MAG: ATP-binding protein [Chloroflexota bacterium]
MASSYELPPTKPGRRRPITSSLSEALLEYLPFPAMIVDAPAERIILSNRRAAELTAYTRAELADLSLQTIFPAWQMPLPLPPSESGPDAHPLILQEMARHRQPRLGVQLLVTALPSSDGQALLIIEPNQLAGQGGLSNLRLPNLWDSLQSLIGLANSGDYEANLLAVLQAGFQLCGAQTLAVYQTQQDSPRLLRCASLGDAQHLPEELPAQELISLRKAHHWVKGKRPATDLQRAARAAGLAWLSTAPLGQPNALVGLIIMADQVALPAETAQAVTKLLATAVTSILDAQALAEKQLVEGEALQTRLSALTAVQENLGEGILQIDQRLRIVQTNPTVEAMLGYASREAIGQPFENILIGSANLAPAIQAALQGSPTYGHSPSDDSGSSETPVDLHLYRRNGDAFLALVRIFPVRNQERIDRVLVFIQDLSEQEQIRSRAQELEQRALLGEVTAIFAHEVRNPINNISTGLQWMALNLPETDSNQEAIVRMLQDCDRLAELIKSVLAYSRPMDYEMTSLDIGALLRMLLERLQPRISRLQIQCDLHIKPDCPPILGNLRALEQVFSNLITNALQAMTPQGGHLALKVQPAAVAPEGAYVEVAVADTGPGIPTEIQERIFQPFYTTQSGGTGLGLAIAKRIVTAHKGSLRLESFPGGTVFYVRLPVAPDTEN